jgi:hypothetical protein
LQVDLCQNVEEFFERQSSASPRSSDDNFERLP